MIGWRHGRHRLIGSADRIGELYDQHIYRPLFNSGRITPIELRELKIFPKGNPHGKDFNPTNPGHNDDRKTKVPILRINATSLNTGHNWCFMASRMGEAPPPSAVADDIDKNTRLRRGRYDEITEKQQAFPLGKAVAASAGVPGLFPPLPVSELYTGWKVELVDGGVYDNQGIAGLKDPDFPCTDFVVSDASGQAQDDKEPQTSLVAVLSRTMSILMGRVREEMVEHLRASHSDKHVAYMHLTRGLDGYDEPFIGAGGRFVESKTRSVNPPSSAFGVEPGIQKLLSRIRTDLDSFTDIEAYALEADGYLMSESELERISKNLEMGERRKSDWRFSRIAKRLADDADETLRKHLDVASHKFAKPFILGISLGGIKALGLIVVSVVALAALAAYIGILWYLIEQILPGWLQILLQRLKECLLDAETALGILAVIVLGLIGEALGRWFKRLRLLRSPAQVAVAAFTRFILPALGAIPVQIYLWTIDRYFVAVLGRP